MFLFSSSSVYTIAHTSSFLMTIYCLLMNTEGLYRLIHLHKFKESPQSGYDREREAPEETILRAKIAFVSFLMHAPFIRAPVPR